MAEEKQEFKDPNPPKEMIKILESHSFLIKPDEAEPYILTEKERQDVIDHEIRRKVEHLEWKMKQSGVPPFEIPMRIAEMKPESLINIEQIVAYANSCKHQKIWGEQRREKELQEIKKRKEELITAWDAKRMFSLLKFNAREKYGKQLLVDENTKTLIVTMCYFLSRDPRFETELNYSFNKGLFIRGIAGVGKTFILHCLEDNELNPILILNMLEIIDEIATEGGFIPVMGEKTILAIDDVGSESSSVKHYGTSVNWFKDFIEKTYFRNKSFGGLIITSNLNFDQIQDRYGFRVRSRMKDMFNIVDVKGKDLRG